MKHTKVLSNLQQEIQSEKVKETYRTEARYFTRKRILTFSCLIYMRLNLMNKSLSVELNKFLARFSRETVSKQAFSKAIQHIKWEGFRYFNDFLISTYYADQEYRKFKDKYLVVAADGTNYELPYEPELRAHFGEYTNTQMQAKCMAQGLKLYDVLNHLTISSVCFPYNEKNSKGNSEKALFDQEMARIEEFIDLKSHQMLLLGDKYYPSFFYLDDLPRRGINFVFRCRAAHCVEIKEFAQSGQKDAILTINMKLHKRPYSKSSKKFTVYPDFIKVRCVRMEQTNTSPIFLLTNLPEEELSYKEVGELYGLRWGEEVSFDTDKNVLEIENFSSKTPNGILQEFFAKTLTLNITELLIADAQKELDQEQATKTNKHTYKINKVVAIGLVKDEIVPFLNGSEPIDTWYPRMVTMILPHRSPVRKRRIFPKKRKHKTKFSMNKRRVT